MPKKENTSYSEKPMNTERFEFRNIRKDETDAMEYINGGKDNGRINEGF